MPSRFLGGTQSRIWANICNDMPSQFLPASLLRHVAWARIEMCFQCNYARDEIFDLVSDGGGSLKIRLQKEDIG